MRLDENFSIENDTHQWTLEYEKIGELNEKTGKAKVTRRQTYHGSLRSALIRYCDEALKPCETIQEVLDEINELESKIENTSFKSS